jgi:hypothetical protein
MSPDTTIDDFGPRLNKDSAHAGRISVLRGSCTHARDHEGFGGHGLCTLPPLKVLVFAASMFGLLGALLDWTLLRNVLRSERKPERVEVRPPQHAGATIPARVRQTDSVIDRARRRPIVFRESCPPTTGLSFYGGAPVGPATPAWPRKPDGVPLSFLMQWDCTALAAQEGTGLLPHAGVLYLFADLSWSDFQFAHESGPVRDWHALRVPGDLPRLYGKGGAHQIPYCSPLVAEELQDVPVLLPKWPFTPIAFTFPAAEEDRFWNEGDAVGEALLRLQHPEGVPPAAHLTNPQPAFARPFPASPHD